MGRPVSTIVFGILNLAFAVWGFFGVLVTAAMLLIPQLGNAVQNPVLQLLHKNANYALFMRISLPVNVVGLVVLALAGVGLLMLKPWGRYLSIIYAVYAILAGIVGIVANYYFVVLPLMENTLRMPAGPEQAGVIGGTIGGTFAGGCLGIIYPLLLLIFMFRANVVAAMRAPAADPWANSARG
jgi:uncharacterized protein with PQ loop repeat